MTLTLRKLVYAVDLHIASAGINGNITALIDGSNSVAIKAASSGMINSSSAGGSGLVLLSSRSGRSNDLRWCRCVSMSARSSVKVAYAFMVVAFIAGS